MRCLRRSSTGHFAGSYEVWRVPLGGASGSENAAENAEKDRLVQSICSDGGTEFDRAETAGASGGGGERRAIISLPTFNPLPPWPCPR